MSNTLSYTLRLTAVALLLGCVAKMPYGYYQFVRIGICIISLVLAYREYEHKRTFTMVACIGFGILFNPIAKVYFLTPVWNGIDVVIAIFLSIWVAVEILTKKKTRQKT